MSAYSVGRSLSVATSLAPLRPLAEEKTTAGGKALTGGASDAAATKVNDPGQIQQSALEQIIQALPAEGISIYVGIYALILTVWPSSLWAAFGVVVIAAAVNIFALYWGARPSLLASEAKDKAVVVGRVVRSSILLTLLFVVYVTATPANPFNTFLHVPLPIGLALAVVAAIVIGIVKPVKAAPAA